jgi:hypothetical protein
MKDLSEIVTIGLPFCVFKFVTGLHLFESQYWGSGSMLMGLGILDTMINGGNLLALLVRSRRILPVCTLTALTQWALRNRNLGYENRMDLGNSIDMALALVLVAGMVGLNRIGALPPQPIFAWNLAVVLNVLGAGLSRLNTSVRQLNTQGGTVNES